jgi:acylphosphatase
MAGTPAEPRTVCVRIQGRVQGVGYRDWAERAAGELGLSGWVRNRRDGSVEAVFSGVAVAVAGMLERCRRGPSAAKVTSVDVHEDAQAPPVGFHVLPTA